MTFTPADTTDYTIAMADNDDRVAKAHADDHLGGPRGDRLWHGAVGSTARRHRERGGDFLLLAGIRRHADPAGVQTLAVTFAPGDTSDYSSAVATETISVARATPTVKVSDSGGVYSGSPFAATTTVGTASDGVSGQGLEGSAPTLCTQGKLGETEAPLNGPPTAAGTYTVVADFPGSSDYSSVLEPPDHLRHRSRCRHRRSGVVGRIPASSGRPSPWSRPFPAPGPRRAW